MDNEFIMQDLFQYDFNNNSKKAFANKHGCSVRKVDNLIIKNNIPCRKKYTTERKRNNFGQFIGNNSNNCIQNENNFREIPFVPLNNLNLNNIQTYENNNNNETKEERAIRVLNEVLDYQIKKFQ